MAERYLVSSGDIEVAARWDGSTLPAVDDDLYANGFTGTITASRTALSWRTTAGGTAVAGGGFSCSTGGLSIGGNVIAGTTRVLLLTHTSGTITLTGNITGSTTTGTEAVLKNGAGGSLTHVGNVTGGSVLNAAGVSFQNTGQFSGTGNCTGGSASSCSALILNSNATGSHTIVGAVTGGSGTNAHGVLSQGSTGTLAITGSVSGGAGGLGISNTSAATITISGNATGGSGSATTGITNSSTGTVTIGGNAIGGTNATITATCFGAYNSGAGSLTVTGHAVGAPSTGVAAGVFGSLTGSTLVGSVRVSATGVDGIAGKVGLLNLQTATLQGVNAALTIATYYPTNFAGLLPAVGDVRSGTVYNLTNSTGTLAVPAAANVLNGISVDATVGTYVTVATGNVRSGTAFGAASALTGTLAVPSAANVLSGVSVDNTTGTYVVVAVGNVRNGTTFGPASASTGTLVLPAIEDVQIDVQYGAAGTEFTGTLETGGDPAAIAQAVWEYTTRGLTEAVELDSSALDPVLDAIDNYVSSVLAGAQLAVGTIVGFPTTLAIGDSYTDDCNSAIHVFIRDANDDPVTSVGDHEFTDLDFAPECTITLSGNTGKVKATVTYVDPGAGESYLKIQIPPKESRRATPGVATVQVVLKWSDSGAQKTLSSQAVTWTNQL